VRATLEDFASATGLPLFTAVEYAGKLGCTPKAVRKRLRRTPPSGNKLPRRIDTRGEYIVAGKPAAAWALGSLPCSLDNRIVSLAKRMGFSSSLEFMLSRTDTLPSLSGLSDRDLHRAQKLQRALAASFSLPAGTSVSELSRVAAPHYAREFGTAVSDRYLRKLIGRILQSGGEKGNFSDLRLYLPKHRGIMCSRSLVTSAAFQFRELDEQLTEIKDRANPTLTEISFVWRKAVIFFRQQVDFGASPSRLKKALRRYLIDRAPFIAKGEASLYRNLDRKLRDAAELGVSAIVDGRIDPKKTECARDVLADFNADLCLLRDHSVRCCMGRLSQAYRELHVGSSRHKLQFSELFRYRFPFDARNGKSEVPAVIRYAVSPKVRLALPAVIGPTAQRNARPKRHLDWSEVASGDWYSGDDVTGNHYIYEFRPDGLYECADGRFNVGRPQWLPTIDEKTQCPLGVSVRLAKRYDKFMILAGTSRVCLDPAIGLPSRGFTFEKGTYASKAVEGLVNWTQIDEAFAREGIGLKIHHAQGPTGKSRIENAIGRMQAMFDFGAGYVGRDERNVRFEHVQKFVARLKKIDQPNKPMVDPRDMLMGLEEYEAELAAAIGRFATEPQNGEILRDGHGRGLSPKEAWSKFASGRAHKLLPPSLGFLMGTHRSKQQVTSDGVRMTINGWKHYYCDAALLNLFRGERVLVRLNPDFPDQVVVAHAASDPHGREAIAVPISERIPAKDATDEDFRRASITADYFFSVGKTYHRVFAPNSNLTVARANLGSADLRDGGETYNRLEREHIELSDRRAAERGTIDRLAACQNLSIDSRKVWRPARVAKHLRAMNEGEAKIKALERNAQAFEEAEPK
jgi:hypothetical protein